MRKTRVSHKPERSKAGQLHKETGRIVIHENAKNVITVYRRKLVDCIKSIKDLDKLIVSDKFLNEWNPEIEIDRRNQFELKQNILNYLNEAEEILKEENAKKIADGKKGEEITESKKIKKAIDMLRSEGKWKENSFRCYEESSASIYIEKHGVAYESGNNYRMDFFQKSGGKIGWELINRFDANNPKFTPGWQKENENKPLWYVCISDLIELNTPDKWKKYTNEERCLARVKKMSDGRLTIDYIADARMTSNNIEYMKVDSVERGLKFITEHRARKIELTPFGKVKRKHKKLWN